MLYCYCQCYNDSSGIKQFLWPTRTGMLRLVYYRTVRNVSATGIRVPQNRDKAKNFRQNNIWNQNIGSLKCKKGESH
jgi:hypothetical protein